MKTSKILLATLAAMLLTTPAFASVTFSVAATTGDGSPLSAVTPGTTLSLAISVTTSAASEMIAIGASVNNWDASLATANAGASTVPATILNTGCFPTFGCVGGIANVETGLRVESNVEGPGEEATFLSLLGFAGAGDTGAIEIAELGPQVTVVFDIPLAVSGSTEFRVGTFIDYADAYNGATDNIVNNTSVSITVPEPGSIGASLAALGTVFGVVAIRRRR